MVTDITLAHVKNALINVNNDVVKFAPIKDSVARTDCDIAHLVCDLAEITESMKYETLDSCIPTIEKINHKIEVLAEARAYMAKIQKIAESNTE